MTPHTQVSAHVATFFGKDGSSGQGVTATPTRMRRTVVTRVGEAVKALALCHNVTPVYEEGVNLALEEGEEIQSSHSVNYQASSPDEVMLDRCRPGFQQGWSRLCAGFGRLEAEKWQ